MGSEVKKLTTADIPVGFRFFKGMIAAFAAQFGLDPALVAAVCWQESAFRADAFRFEPDFWNRYMKPKAEYRELNPRRVSSSYGLMQVMYCRVHEDKLKDNDALPPEHLFVPEMNLRTGCQLLKELIEWATPKSVGKCPPEFAACAAYNGGRGGNDPTKNWPLRNGVYAREVEERWRVMSKEFPV
jgi:soluble lytic murein transglycosylase-like protein